jgi:hypothetical protein
MMATFASLVPDELDTHSWLLHIPGLWSLMDSRELSLGPGSVPSPVPDR